MTMLPFFLFFFFEISFAPPSLRRDIGILGMFHKRVLGLAHPIFNRLLPFHQNEMHFFLYNDTAHKYISQHNQDYNEISGKIIKIKYNKINDVCNQRCTANQEDLLHI